MADEYRIRIADMAVLSRLAMVSAQLEDMAPAYRAIGETVTESTKARFSTSTAPGGSRWEPNAPATILARLAQISGSYTKAGRLSKKGATVAMSKKPLIASGLLQDSFRYQLTGHGVEIGTDRFAGEWDGGAALFHFGSRDGKIPAREIVGLSAEDSVEVMAILANFVEQTIGRS